MKPLVFRIDGMDCVEEVAILKREIGPLVGGADLLAFDILNGKMVIPSGSAPVSAVIEAVARTGMSAQVWEDQPSVDADDAGFWQRRKRIILTGVSGASTVAGFLLHASTAGSLGRALGSEGMGLEHSVPFVSQILYGVAILSGAWYVIPKAGFALRRLQPDMNLLMTLAILGAIGIGEWLEAATVAFLFAVSLALEAWSVGRARRAVAALMSLSPPTARIMGPEGSLIEVPPVQLQAGSEFVVMPGDRIPLDGQVLQGTSQVNQAPITGESIPVCKQPGDEVFAGTINGDGALDVKCTRPAADTTLAQIIRMVGAAQSRRAPSEQWVDKFARYYTPSVLVLAVAVLLVPPLFFGGAWQDWLYRSLVLLVIGCPCALVISTPVSIVAALAASARAGVLVKGGTHMEAPAHVKAIAFDKTGTLTRGRPTVVEVVPMNGHSEEELLERVGAMESRSDHPLARAIREYLEARGISIKSATDHQIIQGKGATAKFNGKQYWLGSHRYLEERGGETAEVHELLEAMSLAGRTVVLVGDEHHVCGFVALEDEVRPEARASLQALRELGIEHIIMLTGDNQGTARAIAKQVGIDEFQAELLPTDKVSAVEALVTRYGTVAMVGDGVNDAPAMGRATIGIAMGAAGSDAAIETADIALMSDDLGRLPWVVGHSRRTLTVIRQNISFSLSVKAIFVVLTFAGHASLWAAIAADMGASLIVIFNALRLLGNHSGGYQAEFGSARVVDQSPRASCYDLASSEGGAKPELGGTCHCHDGCPTKSA